MNTVRAAPFMQRGKAWQFVRRLRLQASAAIKREVMIFAKCIVGSAPTLQNCASEF